MIKKELVEAFKDANLWDFKVKGDNQGVMFYRKRPGRKEMIFVGYRTVWEGFVLQSPTVIVSIDSVEKLASKFDKNIYSRVFGNFFTVEKNLWQIPNVDYTKYDIKVTNKESFTIMFEEFRKIIDGGAFEFYEKYDSLEKIYDMYLKLPVKESSNIIAYPFPARMMIIKKLMNAEDYESYADLKIERYKDSDHIQLQNMAQGMALLKDFLAQEFK